MDKSMERVFIIGQMALSTQDNGSKMKCMGMESLCGLMVVSILGHFS